MKKIFFSLGMFFSPVMVMAQGTVTSGNTSGNIGGLISLFGSLINALIPVASMLATLFFFYGLAMYIMHAGEPEKAQEGKSIMIWGIVALFIMMSIYGISGFLQRSTGFDQVGRSDTIEMPGVSVSKTNY